MGSSGSPSLMPSLLHFALSVTPLFLLSTTQLDAPFKDVNLENPVIDFVPQSHGQFSCERVRVHGTSRLLLKHYANSLHVVLNALDVMPEKLRGRIEVCLHRNVSAGLCQCVKDKWRTLQNGQWSAIISPYETKYVDVTSKDMLSGSVIVTLEEEFHQWRLICLGLGFLLLLLAPKMSTWVPLYVGTSMTVGVLAVVLLLAFQLMKLVPMGRKNFLYITLYGSVLGIGSYIAQYFSTLVNSIVVNFGMGEEMHYPVSVMLLVFIVLAGAGFGYWFVRKYVISEDGSIHASTAEFVKWAMRVIGVVSILLSSLDKLLPVIVLAIYGCICFLVKKINWRRRSRWELVHWEHQSPLRPRSGQSSVRGKEFLNRSPMSNFGQRVWRSSGGLQKQRSILGRSSVNMRAGTPTSSSPRLRSPIQQEDYYSTFHNTPVRKFSRRQWEDFTQESTNEALADWASSPEVARWIADNAHRLKVDKEPVSDDSTESSSESSDETVDSVSRCGGFLNWY